MPVEYRRALQEMKATEVGRADGGGGGVILSRHGRA